MQLPEDRLEVHALAGRYVLRHGLNGALAHKGLREPYRLVQRFALDECAGEHALRHDIAIQYDVAAQAPYYHYTDRGGREHAVWFEDARSIEAKLRLADEYHLQGVGYWNLTRPFPQNWAVLASLFDIETLL